MDEHIGFGELHPGSVAARYPLVICITHSLEEMGAMTGTKTHLDAETAPCGRVVEGDRTREGDADGLVIEKVIYTCGCQRTHHEFHDGSVRVRVIHHGGRVIHHSGKVLMDEHSGDHEA